MGPELVLGSRHTKKRATRVWTNIILGLACVHWLLRERLTASASKLNKMHARAVTKSECSHTH
jgi:hypothetical protein